MYLGDFVYGSTVYVPFHTFDSNGASITLTGLAVTDIEIYKNGSTTQRASDNGYTLLDTDGIDFDGITGIHGFSIDTADNSTAGFFGPGNEYFVVIASVTVDTRTVNFVHSFSIENRAAPGLLQRTTIATLASQTSFTLTAGSADNNAYNGCVAIIRDVATPIQKAVGIIDAYTGASKTVTLRTDPTVFTMATTDYVEVVAGAGLLVNAVNTVVIATGAIDADAIADNAIDAGAIAADAITAAKIADGAIDAATFAAGAINAAAIAADAIGASELAADAVTEIANAVWDTDATGRQTLGTFGQAIGDPAADANTIFKATVTDATGATVGVDAAAILGQTGTTGVVVATGAITTTTFAAGAIDAAAIAANAIGASEIATGAIDADALAADAVDEILDDTIGDGTITVRQALRVLLAGMAAKLSGAATATVTIRNVADSQDVIVATVDASGNRSATTVTP